MTEIQILQQQIDKRNQTILFVLDESERTIGEKGNKILQQNMEIKDIKEQLRIQIDSRGAMQALIEEKDEKITELKSKIKVLRTENESLARVASCREHEKLTNLISSLHTKLHTWNGING